MQPVAALQPSRVQTLPSSQSGGGPPTHAPAEQVSAVVHASPSSQAPATGVWVQPVVGLQASCVQASPSSHDTAGWTHPTIGTHESVVQVSWSSQEGGVPGTHSS